MIRILISAIILFAYSIPSYSNTEATMENSSYPQRTRKTIDELYEMVKEAERPLTKAEKENIIKHYKETINVSLSDETKEFAEFKLKISQILKPKDIKKTSSGCSNSYNKQCEKKDNHFIYGSPSKRSIETPSDVYCFARKACCNKYEKKVNADNYCECYARYFRQESYNLQTINNETFNTISFKDGFCKKELDELDEHISVNDVYDKIFNLCKSEKSDVSYCDKLAQTTTNLIESEFTDRYIRDAVYNSNTHMDLSVKLMFLPYLEASLYLSQYNDIINSDEFKTLLHL